MAYRKTADLTDSELDEQIGIERQEIEDKKICSPVRFNNLLDERIRRSQSKIAVMRAELNQATSQSDALQK